MLQRIGAALAGAGAGAGAGDSDPRVFVGSYLVHPTHPRRPGMGDLVGVVVEAWKEETPRSLTILVSTFNSGSSLDRAADEIGSVILVKTTRHPNSKQE